MKTILFCLSLLFLNNIFAAHQGGAAYQQAQPAEAEQDISNWNGWLELVKELPKYAQRDLELGLVTLRMGKIGPLNFPDEYLLTDEQKNPPYNRIYPHSGNPSYNSYVFRLRNWLTFQKNMKSKETDAQLKMEQDNINKVLGSLDALAPKLKNLTKYKDDISTLKIDADAILKIAHSHNLPTRDFYESVKQISNPIAEKIKEIEKTSNFLKELNKKVNEIYNESIQPPGGLREK